MEKQDIKYKLSTTHHLFKPGELNKISDVSDVKVGHYTLKDDSHNTGITTLIPVSQNIFQSKIPAAVHVGNAFGKFVGSTQVNELGNLETIVGLTNTLAVNDVATFVKDYMKEQNPEAFSINPVVGEINDMHLNDLRNTKFSYENFLEAINSTNADFAEGAVGAGSGSYCYGYKGGIGSASKIVPASVTGLDKDYTVGVLILTNFGGVMHLKGLPVGYHEKKYPLAEKFAQDQGSCIIVVATDAPMLPSQLRRLAVRGFTGLGKTGSVFTNGSGDYALAFSTASESVMKHGIATLQNTPYVPNDCLSFFFWAALEAVEVATYSSMLFATDTTQQTTGNKLEAMDFAQWMEKIDALDALVKNF